MAGSRLVYSTDFGRICPACGQPADNCECRGGRFHATGDGVVRVRRERKGRGGKTVTTVAGVPMDAAGLKGLAAQLKRRCGSGGTVRDDVIEIQGDHVDTLLDELRVQGYTVKKSGG